MDFRGLGLNVILLAATVMIFLLGMEMYFRALSPQTCYAFPKGLYVEANGSLCYRLAANAEGVVQQPEYTVTYKTNSRGMRDDEYSYERDSSSLRIIALGDSFQFGHGVEQDEVFTEIAEAALNREGKRVEIINMGVPGYGTAQQVELLKTEGLKYRPDMVILSFYTEDLFDNIQASCTRYVRQGYLVDNATASERTATFQAKLFLNQNVQSYCFLKNSYVRATAAKFTGRIGIEGNAVEALQKNETSAIAGAWTSTYLLLSEAAQTAKFNNATLMLVAIPHQVQVDDGIWRGVISKYGINEADYDQSLPAKRLAAFAAEMGIRVLDLQPSLAEANREEKLYYSVDGHLNRKGHLEAAKLLTDELRRG